MSNITPASPIPQTNNMINDLLRQINDTTNTPGTPGVSSTVSISTDQLTVLLQCLQQQQEAFATMTHNNLTHASGVNPSSNLSNSSGISLPTTTIKNPEYYNNAKYEDIISKPIKPNYDGSSEQLIPFLNRLDIRRQGEGWYPITFLTIHQNTYDLLRDFTQIDETVMLAEASLRWSSPTLRTDKHTIDHPTFNARVFARLLLASVTDEFCTTIINRVPQQYRNDGPLLLWIICHNTHRNNIAFVETIKRKIREATLSQFSDDVSKYIIHIKDNLRLITSSHNQHKQTHNDLITYLFQQLRLSPITLFKEAIDKWHIKYLEAKLPDLSPEKLLKMVDDKMQTLQHAGQWKESENPSIMALKLELQKQKQESDSIVRHLVAHVSRLSNAHRNRQHTNNYNNNHDISAGTKHPLQGYKQSNSYPSWMMEPPNNPDDTKLVDRRLYTWCKKCRQGQGLWVCRHTTETHVEGFSNNRNQRRRLDRNFTGTPSQPHSQFEGQRSSSFSPPGSHHEPTAHFSLFDYLDDYLPEDESHATPSEDTSN